MTQLLQSELGRFAYEEIAFQCFAVNLRLLPKVANHYNCSVHYTLGYVKTGNRYDFHFDHHDLCRRLNSPDAQAWSLSMHAWLTLQSGEIIDATFGTSMGVLLEEPLMYGGVVSSYPDKLQDGMEYFPVVLGTDILQKLAVICFETTA